MILPFRQRLTTVVAGVSLAALGCGGAPPPPSQAAAPAAAPPASVAAVAPMPADPLSAESLMADVEALASVDLHGRGSGTQDETQAAYLLAHSLDLAGIEAPGSPPVRIQAFSSYSVQSQNVLGIVRPEGQAADAPLDSLVVLGAHYDHLGVKEGQTYFGADDNASGTALVLGVARALSARRGALARPVLVAFFGAEEKGMLGSRAFINEGPIPRQALFAMINVDMVGRPLTDQPLLLPLSLAVGIDPQNSVGVEGLRDRPGFQYVVREACQAEGHRAVTIDDLPEVVRPTIERMAKGRGDNAPFEEIGVPAIFFSSSESSDYHQPSDTVATLSPELLAIRARVVLKTVLGVAKLRAP